jgi:FemAB-related protein (PEP-CTERM system-associated)
VIATSVLVRCATADDATRWDEFVSQHFGAVNYHRWNWQEVISRSFGWNPHYLLAESDGQIKGILPLFDKKTIFGSALVSVPFFSTGGMIADSDEVARSLLDAAIAHAKEIGAERIELRQRSECNLGIPVSTHKVTLVAPIPSDPEERMRGFDTKMRTHIRRSLKFGLEGELGGNDFVEDFYSLFAAKMRDFGTPVYAVAFFRNIFQEFPTETFIYRVRYQGQTIAATFLTAFKGSVEANWSSSLPQFSSLKPNVFMYWMAMSALADRGYRSFDFGRSTVGSGTYNFKRQWNTEEIPLHWYYWADGHDLANQDNRERPLIKTAMWIWRRLPVGLTRSLGPYIARDLP